MIRGIYILVEGQTEEEFVKSLLLPFFHAHEFYDVRAILMSTSPGHKGGAVTYSRFKKNAETLLSSQQDIIVTSLIDFFRLESDFPKYSEGKKLNSVGERVAFYEQACAVDINHPRFIPNIQLHEFEGLLFTSTKGFDLFPDLSDQSKEKIGNIIRDYPNPELINDGSLTAPSKRLEKIIPGYQKPFHGPLIALENSFELIIEKCPRFKAWVELLLLRVK
ncbi:MAG: DUF4276 family protein [Bacteroidetes bacterium]|nr:DUF4276 family protein [Bacteroidota bacterium]